MKKVSLSKCTFNKEQRYLQLSSEYIGMPISLQIESQHTGRVVEFTVVDENDPLFDQDGWDGEMQIYRPAKHEARTNVDYLIIHHEY
jgi:hypothetical protein